MLRIYGVGNRRDDRPFFGVPLPAQFGEALIKLAESTVVGSIARTHVQQIFLTVSKLCNTIFPNCETFGATLPYQCDIGCFCKL